MAPWQQMGAPSFRHDTETHIKPPLRAVRLTLEEDHLLQGPVQVTSHCCCCQRGGCCVDPRWRGGGQGYGGRDVASCAAQEAQNGKVPALGAALLERICLPLQQQLVLFWRKFATFPPVPPCTTIGTYADTTIVPEVGLHFAYTHSVPVACAGILTLPVKEVCVVLVLGTSSCLHPTLLLAAARNRSTRASAAPVEDTCSGNSVQGGRAGFERATHVIHRHDCTKGRGKTSGSRWRTHK